MQSTCHQVAGTPRYLLQTKVQHWPLLMAFQALSRGGLPAPELSTSASKSTLSTRPLRMHKGGNEAG